MTVPAVTITQVDGGLGVQPPVSGRYLAVIGPAAGGPLLTPAAYSRPSQLASIFTGGPLVEEGAIFSQRYARPVIAIRTQGDTAGSYGTFVFTGTGTSVASAGGSEPNDDYDVFVQIIAGGTRGTTGITYQWSLDGGRTMSPTTALGTATSIVIPGSGVTIALAAGTLVAGDTIAFPTSQSVPNATHVGAALTALQNSNLPWEFAQLAFPLDGTLFDQVETSFAGLFGAGKYRSWFGGFRRPNVGESESTYKTAFDTAFATRSTIIGSVTAGDAKIASAISGRQYRRRISSRLGPLQASVSEEVNIADMTLGPVSGLQIADANGNPENHDESANAGLDDSRALTVMSRDNRTGVFVTRPRILCPTGSDFTIVPYRRVMNLFMSTILLYLQDRLNKPIRVSKKTGFIIESDAVEIERGGLARLRPALLSKPKASDITFSVSRTDDLLGTKTLTGDGGIVPLAYPEFINWTVGFFNPALQVIQV
jgi:hypothetical protein